MPLRLTFDENYFKEEERDGFLVSGMMKRAWAAMLKVLAEIDRVCSKHNIKYFASFGTLLGAARHNGFIPWDDDMDISMLREDYMKFLSVVDEMEYPFRVKSIYTQDDFSQYLSVVSNSRQTKLTWDEERIRDFYGCPYIVGIDVNAFDYVPRDPDMKRLQQLIYYMGYSLSKDYENGKADTPEFDAMLSQFGARTGFNVDKQDPHFHNKVMRAADQIAMHCSREDADYVCYYPQMAYLENGGVLLPADCFEDVTYLPFENTEIPVPYDYKRVLEHMYGLGYMTPVKGVASHDYPFYSTQEEYFRFTGDIKD